MLKRLHIGEYDEELKMRSNFPYECQETFSESLHWFDFVTEICGESFPLGHFLLYGIVPLAYYNRQWIRKWPNMDIYDGHEIGAR
jgi:hypothetical protein